MTQGDDNLALSRACFDNFDNCNLSIFKHLVHLYQMPYIVVSDLGLLVQC